MRRIAYSIALLLSVMTLAPLSAAAQQALVPRESDTAKKCAICHYRWVYTFFVEHRSTPLARLEESKDSVGETKMCLSCHDGSVRDSRDKVCNTPSHKCGITPSDRVTIPANFPLSDSGTLLCSTCHTPHAVAGAAETLRTTFMREANVNSSLCIKCHTKNLGGPGQGNHPLDVSVDRQPDALTKAGGRFGTDKPNQVICETCHMAHGGAGDKRLVLLVRDTSAPAILCEVCHSNKPKKPGEPDSARYSHPVDVKPGNRAHIPETWSSGEKIQLSLQGDLICFTCHRTHRAADKEFLLNEQTGENGLCVRCHSSQKAVLGSTHDLRLSQHPQKNDVTTPGGPCGACHAVHKGKAPFMWSRNLPPSSGCFEAYCKSCHAAGQCAEKTIPAAAAHPASRAGAVNSAGLPLFAETCEQSSRGMVACMTCHDVHNPSPVTETTTAGETGKYLRLGEAGQAALCTSCHAEQGMVRGTPHDMSIAAPGYRNLRGQSPAQASLCGSCHIAHGAALKQDMWAGPIGTSVPAEWLKKGADAKNTMISLCTGCHANNGVARKHVPRFGLHPGAFYSRVSEIANKLQKLNICLYTPSGSTSPLGGIVCSTCHNPHQWDGKKRERGTGLVEGTIVTSFLRPDLPQAFCVICHGADALGNYLYFHNRPARAPKPEQFPFGDLQ